MMNRDTHNDSGGKHYPPVTGIGRDEHVGMVREIFATITVRYDFLNHLLSLRRDIAWRRFTVRKMRFFRTFRLLDVATGTADLAIDAAGGHPGVHVVGIDFVGEMLALGREKIARRGLRDRIRLLQADAMALPFPDGSFDAAGIAFGIRNMPDRLRALREMRRVIVPGGQLFVLEMSFPRHRLWQGFFDLYLNRLLPGIARFFSGNPAAYHYLADSILHFPSPQDFMRTMEEAGCRDVERHPLTFGITSLYIGNSAGIEERSGA
jgi:demethylmenaquinone methyltransferase / 2-methoxy-6-polyprenyl-1,4-benzoquinol methylase